MAVTQAQMLAEYRDHLGDINSNQKSDYQLILSMVRAYRTAWPDWYLEVRDTDTYTGYAALPPGTLSVPVPTALVGGRIFNIFGRTNIFSQGTAFTLADTTLATNPWLVTTIAHGLSTNQQVQVNGGKLPTGIASRTLYYTTLPPTLSYTASTNNGSATFTVPINNFRVGVPVILSGNIPTGFSSGTTYYVQSTASSTTLTLSATSGGNPITANSTTSSITITINTTLTFQLSTSSGGVGTGILFATGITGSGYVGNYVDTSSDYSPFNKWWRGIRIDPTVVTSTNAAPRIRFAFRDATSFEMDIQGAAQLNYPYVSITAAATDTFTAPSTYVPLTGDTVWFYAVAPNSFSTTSATPYYVVNVSGQTFKLSATNGGSAITTSSSGSYNIFPGSQSLTGTDFTWFYTFLLWAAEKFARAGLQRSGNLDRKAQSQRRLLAQQEEQTCRGHRMQPTEQTLFSWDG